MRTAEALQTTTTEPHYRVRFDRRDGYFLVSDYFPDEAAGDAPILTEDKAWEMAAAFAYAPVNKGYVVNVVVVRVYEVNGRIQTEMTGGGRELNPYHPPRTEGS